MTESERRLQLVLDSTTEGWWEWDVATNQTYHSPGWYKMLGLQPNADHAYETWIERMHPEDRANTEKKQREYMQRQNTWEIEFRMKMGDGNYRWIESRGRVISRDSEGLASKVVGVHIDIDDRKQLEITRREKEIQQELLEGVIRVSQASLNIYDFIRKRLVFSTGHILEKMNYDREEFFKHSENYFSDLIHQDDRFAISEHIKKILYAKPGDTLSVIFRMRGKDEKYRSILLKDSVFRTAADGFPTHIVGSAIDVTHYQELKANLEKSVKFLEALSFKNSHELRAPVATVLGLLEIIKLEINTKEETQEILGLLERSIYKMDLVIRDFNNQIESQIKK